MANAVVSKHSDSGQNVVNEIEAPFFSIKALFIFAALFAVCCLLLFTDLGKFPLFNPDEALYAEPAREMREKGEYITTMFNYAVRYTKPPLCIWAIALNYQLFGVTEFAARFFGAACGAVLVAATYLFARIHLSTRAAVFSAFALFTAPLFFGTAREAVTDMPLSLFTAAAIMSFYHAYTRRGNFWSWLGYGLVGLAVMTKGPIGMLIPGAVLAVFHLLRRDVKQALFFYKPWLGIFVVAVIAVPWFATEIAITKGAYFNEFILHENLQRFTAVVDHKAPWWYHFAVMPTGFFPWTIFLPAAIAQAVKGNLKRISNIHPVALLSLCWITFVLGFFSLSVSKLVPYTLPAFPALALLIGQYFDNAVTERTNESKLATPSTAAGKTAGLTLGFAALAILYGAVWFAIPMIFRKVVDCPPTLIGIICTAVICQVSVSLVALALSFRRFYIQAIACFGVVTFLSTLVLGGQALAAISDKWELPIKSFAQFAAASQRPIIVYGIRKPSVTFYAQRKILLPRSMMDLNYILQSKASAYVIGRLSEKNDVQSLKGCKLLTTTGQYFLVLWQNPQKSETDGSSKTRSDEEHYNLND